jgi:hypothetical protein
METVKLATFTLMNPTTSSPRLSKSSLSPLPANFDRWPKAMQDRYRRFALAGIQ